MSFMVLTMIVGWLVVSVLSAALWSLVVRRSHARDWERDDVPNYDFPNYDVPNYVVEAADLPVGPSPRRTPGGMAESGA